MDRDHSDRGLDPPPRRALLSVSDKRGLADLARGLVERGWELVSTGGTARLIREAGLPVTDVAAVTGAPEMLDGRVKTLHPRIAAAVLADLRQAAHREQLAAQGIAPFGLVVVNLYPFEATAARQDVDDDALIEEIDIGGPTLVRAAAKNHACVGVVCDPDDYPAILVELDTCDGRLSAEVRRTLALKAFRLTAAYDAAISAELARRWAPGQPFPERLTLGLRRSALLRYGENPHQAAALYTRSGVDPAAGPLAEGARLLAGKPLSYNNLLDTAAAAGLARDLRGSAVVIVKHGNPCGAAEAADLPTAWARALAGDPVSAFGGVVAVRGTVDATVAELLAGFFLEVVVAAHFEPAAVDALAARPDLRLVEDATMLVPAPPAVDVRSAGGAILLMESDARQPTTRPDWTCVYPAGTGRARAGRPRARLACRAPRAFECHRPRPRRSHRGRGCRADEPRHQRPPGRRAGGRASGRGRGRVRCLLPLRRRAGGLPGGRCQRGGAARRLAP